MADQNWVSSLVPGPHASGAGTVLNTAATATISPNWSNVASGSDVVQIAAAPFGWQPGLLLRVRARGFITTTATSTTATFFLRANKSNLATSQTFVTLATTAGITTGTAVLTGVQWRLDADIRCTAVAPTGSTVSTQGEIRFENNATAPSLSATTNGVVLAAPLPATSGETAAAVDTTLLQGIGLAATLAAATATIQLTQWLVEALD